MLYSLLISHVGKDRELALDLVKQLNNYSFEIKTEEVIVNTVCMEDEEFGCSGDFLVWSEDAVTNSTGILAIISPNTLEKIETADGIELNRKIVYDEISLAKELFKDVIVVKDANTPPLESGYRILLQNITSLSYSGKFSEEDIKNIKGQIRLHAKRRLEGDPYLEYAGITVNELACTPVRNSGQFVGRKSELDNLDRIFSSMSKVACISGFGGMGKTTLAKMYAYTHPEYSVYFYRCQENESLKKAIIGFEFTHSSSDFDKLSVEDKYQANVRRLMKIEKPTLIILDNFDQDYQTMDNILAIEDLWTLPQCKVIITSRNTEINRPEVSVLKVKPIEEIDLTELFYRDSCLDRTPENDELIKKLFEITDRHTMTIELVAKAVGNDRNAVTLEEVIDRLLDKDGVKTRLEDGIRTDGSNNYDTIFNHITKLFDISKLNRNQKYLVGCLSYIPTDGLTAVEIKEAVDDHSPESIGKYEPEDLNGLVRLGIVSGSDGKPKTYSLHPLISEIVAKRYSFNEKTFYKFVSYVIDKKLNYFYYDSRSEISKKIKYGTTIWDKLKFIDCWESYKALSFVGNRLGLFYSIAGEDESAKFYLSQAINYCEKFADNFQTNNFIESRYQRNLANRLVASLNKTLADIYKKEGLSSVAEEYYQKSMIASTELKKTANSLSEVANYFYDYACIYEQTESYDQAEICILKCIELSEPDSPTLFSGLALSDYYLKLASIQIAKQKYTDAEATVFKTLQLCERLKTGESLRIYKTGLSRIQKVGDADVDKKVALCYNKLGNIYAITGKKKDAEFYLQGSINVYMNICAQSSELENKSNLAWAYDSAFAFYYENKKFGKAKKMAKKAVEITSKIAHQTETNVIYDKLTDYLVDYEFSNVNSKPFFMRMIYSFVLSFEGPSFARKIYIEHDLNYDYFMKKFFTWASMYSKNSKKKRTFENVLEFYKDAKLKK